MKKIISIALICFLTACSSSPQNRYYTLTSLAPPASRPAPAQLPSVGIMSVTVPELVDRPHLVIGGSGSSVDILEFDRWGEPLKSAILRVLADNLARQLGSDRVAAYPQVAALDTELQISIDFQGFSVTDGVVLVDALWRIKGNNNLLHNGRSRTVQKITGNFETVAEAYSRALAVVSADIAAAITGKNGSIR